jgi:hypothetical protein
MICRINMSTYLVQLSYKDSCMWNTSTVSDKQSYLCNFVWQNIFWVCRHREMNITSGWSYNLLLHEQYLFCSFKILLCVYNNKPGSETTAVTLYGSIQQCSNIWTTVWFFVFTQFFFVDLFLSHSVMILSDKIACTTPKPLCQMKPPSLMFVCEMNFFLTMTFLTSPDFVKQNRT